MRKRPGVNERQRVNDLFFKTVFLNAKLDDASMCL